MRLGADINAQTDETQETALTLACCGGFQDVVQFLIKAGGDLELGCSTPLMEAAQEGHLSLVNFLLETCKRSFHCALTNFCLKIAGFLLTFNCANCR